MCLHFRYAAEPSPGESAVSGCVQCCGFPPTVLIMSWTVKWNLEACEQRVQSTARAVRGEQPDGDSIDPRIQWVELRWSCLRGGQSRRIASQLPPPKGDGGSIDCRARLPRDCAPQMCPSACRSANAGACRLSSSQDAPHLDALKQPPDQGFPIGPTPGTGPVTGTPQRQDL